MNKVEKIWKSLEQNNYLSSGLVMKRYSAEMRSDVYVALIMPEKTRSIAFRFSKKMVIDRIISNNLKDVKIHIVNDLQEKSKKLLVISLLDFEFSETFSVLCEDLILNVPKNPNEIELFSNLFFRLEQWKDLFEKVKSQPLTLNAQIGLFGELYMLNRLIESIENHLLCIDLWKGPDSGIRDFEKYLWAIEVKTTSTNNQQKLFINNERQLDNTHLNDLYLFHISVEVRDEYKININSIVDEIKIKIHNNSKALSLFELKLIKAGYFSKDINFYYNYGFKIKSENIYRIFDDFPRIKKADLRLNVGNVRYSIILPEEDKYKASYEEMILKLGENYED